MKIYSLAERVLVLFDEARATKQEQYAVLAAVQAVIPLAPLIDLPGQSFQAPERSAPSLHE